MKKTFLNASDAVETVFSGSNEAPLVQSFIRFTHQALVYADPDMYSFDRIVDGFCRNPEIAVRLCKFFEAKFHPEKFNSERYLKLRSDCLRLIESSGRGQTNHILRQGLNFIDHLLKTNFYCPVKSAFSFRLDPTYLDNVPYDRKKKFPILPYGVFFIHGAHFIGFHIRFKDLARGGVRTVIVENDEQFALELNSIFSEAYNLALTQQKKNKDIPEGGAKMACLLKSCGSSSNEDAVLAREPKESRLNFLYSSQRSCIESLMTLINGDDSGALRSKFVIDYLKKPEYIYLGPDENMHNSMIEWIADYAEQSRYRPGRSFMTGKTADGINHKEYGVTSSGVNIYMHQALLYLKINPEIDPFTVKFSGGPDGDVAGNQILNLFRHYPKTARIAALIDISGTIYDPAGLDFNELSLLFKQELPIRHYPPDRLSEGGFLLDLQTKHEQQTLCWQTKNSKLIRKWLNAGDAIALYKNTVPQTPCDVFIPAGGRPETLNESNFRLYLDDAGRSNTKAIVEGANLYLTAGAREALEKRGALIFKDSSCNKGGVIASSFEVLAGLCLSREEFLEEKQTYVKEVLTIIRKAALNEAKLMLSIHQSTGERLSVVSDKISDKINQFKYQLLGYLENIELPDDPKHFWNRCLLNYCPPLLKNRYAKRVFAMPGIHKKAIIASYLAANLVYSRGLALPSDAIELLPSLENRDAF